MHTECNPAFWITAIEMQPNKHLSMFSFIQIVFKNFARVIQEFKDHSCMLFKQKSYTKPTLHNRI